VSSGSGGGTEDCLNRLCSVHQKKKRAGGLALEIAVVAGSRRSTEDCPELAMFRTLDYKKKKKQEGWHWR
jgi:hypothetical protein